MIRFLALVLLAGTAILQVSSLAAAPAAKLIDSYWLESGTSEAPDYDRWNRFLGAYLAADDTGINRVDYGRVSDGDLGDLLRAQLQSMQALDPTRLDRDDQFAYWVNLYNLVTVLVVLEGYPVDSIRNLGGWFASGPWDEDVVTVAGRELSLNDIEHGILRPIWKDPRIHYAVNCASIGCPNLATEAYVGDRLEEMLEAAARDYINHPRGAAFEDGELVVSSIFEWYQVDFGDSERGVIAHLANYAEPALRAELATATRIARDRYDWRLNEP